jgi:hypothetical protein
MGPSQPPLHIPTEQRHPGRFGVLFGGLLPAELAIKYLYTPSFRTAQRRRDLSRLLIPILIMSTSTHEICDYLNNYTVSGLAAYAMKRP